MANQKNYVQLVPSNPQSFSVSRIAESANDFDIIEGRLPAQFGFDVDDNIEMHFYDSTNRLVGSLVVPIITGIVSSRTIQLPNNEVEEKILIDMTRVQKELGLLIPPGTYTVTLNFFSNEIGTYLDKKLTIEEVSPSRTELRLGFTRFVGEEEESELFEFVEPSVPRVLAAGLVESTLGVEGAGIVESPITGEQLPIDTTIFTSKVIDALLNINPNLISEMVELESDLPNNLELTIELMSAAIYDEFLSLLELTRSNKQFDRLQENEIVSILEKAVDNAFLNNNVNLYTQNQITYV